MIFKCVSDLNDSVDVRRNIVLRDNNSKDKGPFIGDYFDSFVVVKDILPLLTLVLTLQQIF